MRPRRSLASKQLYWQGASSSTFIPFSPLASELFLFSVEDLAPLTVEERVSVRPGLFPMERIRPSRSDRPKILYSSRTVTVFTVSGSVIVRKGAKVAIPILVGQEDFIENLVVARGTIFAFGVSTLRVGGKIL